MNTHIKALEETTRHLSQAGKGILAADESMATISKRFEALSIANSEDNRRAYRELLMGSPGLNQYIAGVILFEETLNQSTSQGQKFSDFLRANDILPGIKVDKGLVPLLHSHDEHTTQGLDGLAERLVEHREQGACFAKWRAVYHISDHTPSSRLIKLNAQGLAIYAATCQANGIMPIVEPEILLTGTHTIEQSATVTEKVLHAVFHALHKHHVALELMILKPSMVISGHQCIVKASVEDVGKKTVEVLRRTVPAAVPTINFLSGGQSPEEATAHLQVMNSQPNNPWHLSYSYARALQDMAMSSWGGQPNNLVAAQQIFIKRCKLNSLASLGQYQASMENDQTVA